MPKYIDTDKIRYTTIIDSDGRDSWGRQLYKRREVVYKSALDSMPAADVASRAEVDKLEYTLMGVMHSVDKWLDGDELKQDEVNRAITMREKTLQIVENARAEVAAEIFNEITKMFFEKQRQYENSHQSGKARQMMVARCEIYKLRKKYLEGK